MVISPLVWCQIIVTPSSRNPAKQEPSLNNCGRRIHDIPYRSHLILLINAHLQNNRTLSDVHHNLTNPLSLNRSILSQYNPLFNHSPYVWSLDTRSSSPLSNPHSPDFPHPPFTHALPLFCVRPPPSPFLIT